MRNNYLIRCKPIQNLTSSNVHFKFRRPLKSRYNSRSLELRRIYPKNRVTFKVPEINVLISECLYHPEQRTGVKRASSGTRAADPNCKRDQAQRTLVNWVCGYDTVLQGLSKRLFLFKNMRYLLYSILFTSYSSK